MRLFADISLLAISIALAAVPHSVELLEPGPTPAATLVLPVDVVEVYDGDTVTVEVTVQARVRLLDCWAPEIRTKDPAEKMRGYESAQHLRDYASGKRAMLTIPLEGRRLGDVLSFGRVLGRLHVDGRDLSELQVSAGHAIQEKPTRTARKAEPPAGNGGD